MRQRRKTPRRREAPRWAPEEWTDATMVLLRRSGGRCERCGLDLGGRGERHHRERRRDGGDRLSNLILVHPWCHSLIHSTPSAARMHGWIVPTWVEDPSTAPVMIAGRWWLLDDLGNRLPTDPPPPPTAL